MSYKNLYLLYPKKNPPLYPTLYPLKVGYLWIYINENLNELKLNFGKSNQTTIKLKSKNLFKPEVGDPDLADGGSFSPKFSMTRRFCADPLSVK